MKNFLIPLALLALPSVALADFDHRLQDNDCITWSGDLDSNTVGGGLQANIDTTCADLQALDDRGAVQDVADDLQDHIDADLDTDPTNELQVITVAPNVAGGTDVLVDGVVVGNVPDDAGTDDQAISLTGNTLSIEDGGTVDLSGFVSAPNLDNDATNELGVIDATAGTYDPDGSGPAPAQPLPANSNTDDQALTRTGDTLTLEDGGTPIDLSDLRTIADNGLSMGTTGPAGSDPHVELGGTLHKNTRIEGAGNILDINAETHFEDRVRFLSYSVNGDFVPIQIDREADGSSAVLVRVEPFANYNTPLRLRGSGSPSTMDLLLSNGDDVTQFLAISENGDFVRPTGRDFKFLHGDGAAFVQTLRIDDAGALNVGEDNNLNTASSALVTDTIGGRSNQIDSFTRDLTGLAAGEAVMAINGMDTAAGIARGLINFYSSAPGVPGPVVGRIQYNDVTGSVQYLTTSDANTKTNVEAVVGAMDRVMAVRPVTFDRLMGGADTGFIAQKFAEQYPTAVSGVEFTTEQAQRYEGYAADRENVLSEIKSRAEAEFPMPGDADDAVVQTVEAQRAAFVAAETSFLDGGLRMDQSVLIPDLVAVVQEQQRQIAELRAMLEQ